MTLKWRPVVRKCTHLKKRDSHLKQYFDLYHSMAPLPHLFTSPLHPHILTNGVYLGCFPLHNLFLYLDTPPPRHPPIFLLVQAIFEQNFLP